MYNWIIKRRMDNKNLKAFTIGYSCKYNELYKELVSKGYAEVAYLYGDYLYTNELKEEQEKSKKLKIGIWSIDEQTKTSDKTEKKTKNKTKKDNEYDKLIDEIYNILKKICEMLVDFLIDMI